MLCATSTFIFVFTTTRTEPVTAFFVVLSLYFLLGDARPRRGAAGFLAVSAMIWAATVRVSSLPAAFLVLGIVLYQNRDSRVKCAMIVLGAVLQFAIILGIPFAAARENMIFHVFTAQLERYTHFQPGARFSLRRHVAEVSAAIVDHLTRLYVGVASATLALGTFGLFTFKSQLIRRIKPHYLIIAGLALALYIPQLTVRWIGEVYLMPSITILAILVGCGMSDLYYKLRSSAGATLVLAVAVSMILTQAANCVHDERWHMTLDYWPIAHLDEVARYVQQVVGPDEQIATLSTYIALEAHRRVPPGFEMSWFSLFPGLSNERAAQLKVINRALFDEALRDPKTRCVAVTHYEFGLLAGTQGKRPPPRIMTEEEVLGLLDGLPSDYKLAKVVTHFGQIYDTLYILTR
jgi:hypothetical protein